jgi:hypothetical protein
MPIVENVKTAKSTNKKTKGQKVEIIHMDADDETTKKKIKQKEQTPIIKPTKKAKAQKAIIEEADEEMTGASSSKDPIPKAKAKAKAKSMLSIENWDSKQKKEAKAKEKELKEGPSKYKDKKPPRATEKDALTIEEWKRKANHGGYLYNQVLLRYPDYKKPQGFDLKLKVNKEMLLNKILEFDYPELFKGK